VRHWELSEIRETLRFGSTDLEEMNRVMGRLQDRLDALEGLRGEPAFHADVNIKENQLLNVSGLYSDSGGETVYNNKVIFTLPPNIPFLTTIPTGEDLPNIGDIAIWYYVGVGVYIVVRVSETLLARTDALTGFSI